jgi:hypothetical protein
MVAVVVVAAGLSYDSYEKFSAGPRYLLRLLLAAGVMPLVHLPEPHQLEHHRSSFSSCGCLPELPQPLLLSDLAKPVEVVV